MRLKKLIMVLFIISILVSYISIENQNINYSRCSYQGQTEYIGIGLLIWNGDCPSRIVIYKDSLLNKPFVHGNLCKKINICPFLYKPDYGIFHFITIDIGDEYYKISFNNGKEIGFIPKYDFFKFTTWENFFINEVVGIRRKGGNGILKIMTLNKDTLIGIDEFNKLNKVKWKENNQILIDIFLLN